MIKNKDISLIDAEKNQAELKSELYDVKIAIKYQFHKKSNKKC